MIHERGRRFVPYLIGAGILAMVLAGCVSTDPSGAGPSAVVPGEGPETVLVRQLRAKENPNAQTLGWAVASTGSSQTYLQSRPANRLAMEAAEQEMYLGAVYLYENGNDTSTVTFLDGGAINMAFGASVAISPDETLVVVGAPGMSPEDESFGYAYLKSPAGWATEDQYPTLFGFPGAAGVRLGMDVALSGGSGRTVLFGAPGDDGHGRVYYFLEPPEGWTTLTNANFQSGFLGASDAANGHEFGRSVAISRDDSRIVIGAPGHSDQAGMVYLFEKPADGWLYTQTLFPIVLPESVPKGRFGQSVAISADGSVIAVGACGTNGACGNVYIITDFDTAKGSYNVTTLAGAAECENLGLAVDVSADGRTVAAGGFGTGNSGFVRVYATDDADWTESSVRWQLAGQPDVAGEQGSMLGYDLDLSDDGRYLLVGAPLYNNGMGTTAIFDVSGES